MKLSFKHLLFICLLFFFYSVSFAQLSDTSKVISLSAQELYFNRSDNEEKMSSDLFYMVVHFLKETYKGQAVQKVITELKKDEFSTFDDKNRLLVFIRLKSNSKSDETQLVNLINNNGGEVYHQEVGHNNLSEITAYLPIQAIIKIADNEKTALIKKPIPILFHTYTSAGDEQLKAQQVRQLFNVDGSNIKIGVISDGADKWSQAYVANELPMISIIRNGSGDEGTAMMEIIHDIAPSSELIFAGVRGLLYPVNWASIAGLVNELHYTRGCKIIVDDFYTPEEPFFSDEGLFGEAIRNFINDGGVYITAAGNSRKSLYSGITSLGSGYHIFPDGKDYLEFVLEGSDYLYLQWSTSWTNPSLDLDLEALNTTTNTTYYSSSNQSYTTPPIENLDLTEPGVYRLKVKKRTGLETVEFKILSVMDNNIPNNNINQIFGHSAYPNVISVAAYQANNQNTTSDYSSIGPALMYSAAIGQWTVQEVPTITATSGVETWVGSTGLWSGGYPVFDGTSASAPHIAGLAALYFHKLNGIDGLNKSNLDFKNDLTLSAATIESGTTGGTWNNKSGFGKADILAAINRSLQTVATPIITPAGGTYPPPQTISITCATTGSTIYYTVNGTEPSNTNGTLYTTAFTINTNMTIKAKAYKTGYTESATITEVYTISNQQAVATVTPSSGTYPEPLKLTVSWYGDGYECYTTRTYDGTDPPDPSNAGNNVSRIWYTPYSELHPYVYLFKLKVQLKKDGNWGPVVYVQYDIKPSLRIAQIDDEISESFGQWNKWENNQWIPHPDETVIRPTQTSDWFIKASQEFKDTDVFRKYNVWTTNQGTNYFVNHAKIPVGPNTSSVLAHFKQTYNVTIMNKLENSFSVNQGSFIFKNPWIVDDNSDPKGPRNRGDGTVVPLLPYTINFSTSPNITTSSIHKGVFLNQSGPGSNWQPPYYSVKAESVQDVQLNNTGYPYGRNHKFYFQNWGGTNVNYQNANALETPVVFTLNGATAQANLKGTQLSNKQFAGGYGQRGFVRSTNGYLHNVYESMGDIWYERSTDNGTTWLLMNDGKPINPDYQTADAKSPSVCFDANYNLLYVVYQSSTFPYYGIVLAQFGTSAQSTAANWVETITEPESYSYSNNYKPVIAAMGGEGVIVYDLPSSLNAGIKGVKFYIDTNSDFLGTNNFTVPGADQYSENPSIAAGCQNFYLVYEQNQTSIRYLSWAGGSSPSGYTNISSGSSYLYNVRPIISLEHCTYPVVSWIGGTYDYYHSGFYQGSCVMTRVGPSWGSIKIISASNSQVVNNNSTTEYGSEYKSVIAYSYGSYAKWVKREGGSYTTPAAFKYNGFGVNGIRPQISSAASINDMKALIYNSNTLPYYFIQSTTNLGTGLGKISLAKTAETDTIITFGRSGVVDKNGVEFVFEIGDILVGDKIISFIEVPDTIAYTSIEQLNKDTRTENFTLSPETQFYFSNIYSVVKKSNPDSALTSSDAVNFKAELVNAVTNQIVGAFDNVTYDKTNLERYANIDYQVDCTDITAGEYYLRLVTKVAGEANYTLANIVSDNTTLAKKSFNKVNFTGKEIPAAYELAQNFPNPFNPSTTIKYQIPASLNPSKGGTLVTLKVYDILGKEVATLVNEEKDAGYYEVNFDASLLASGVYIYKIQAGSFINSKKMLLLK